MFFRIVGGSRKFLARRLQCDESSRGYKCWCQLREGALKDFDEESLLTDGSVMDEDGDG